MIASQSGSGPAAWRLVLVALLGLAVASPAGHAADPEAIERGAYVFRAAGCFGCHSDSVEGALPLAGGRALATPFGTFYSPNITPHPDAGIGGWQEGDLRRALKEGRAPDGRDYYPAFPYTAYSGMSDQDIGDLWAYLMAQPVAETAVRDHDLDFPFSMRWLIGFWKWLFFEPQDFAAEPAEDAVWNRGAYLVRHLGHCGECHSPRGLLGQIDGARELAGNPKGPEGKKVPGIAASRLADWSGEDIEYLLLTGLTPEGDVVAGSMAEVVRHGTKFLSAEDRAAIAAYLQTVQLPD